ncbi:uncharacterized protein LOC116001364 [Ipomoea triloba]|uniref:uncharacterized protein LOC116001364 n=1 Tax=Ipomoea triloba TaxID=35885 RepID=UPI00125D24FF|nr:uncharacterized protein LOC116001364 [Ipomoea triloba]
MFGKHNPDILCLLETKTSGNNADDICINLGYAKWARVEALGFSGGIWILWNEEFKIDILHSHPQFVHLQVERNMGRICILSVVYGSPSVHLRRRLWRSLNRSKLNIFAPWLVAGDFNAVVSNDETSSPDNSGHVRNSDFKTWIYEEELIDLGFSGQKFTWKRGKAESTFKGARLDRALCSFDWIEKFPNTKVSHLTTLYSDHCPVLIEIDKPRIFTQNPFKFQGAWPRHPKFLDAVREAWKQDETAWANKDSMTNKLKDWNRNTFGNIHHRKSRLLKRLDGIQNHIDQVNHSGILRLERKIRRELEEVLHQEEIMCVLCVTSWK